MKIQFVSDLHLEFPENRIYLSENPIEPTGDILILAGDIICDIYKKKARQFYELWHSQYELIISTMGNHEFYKGTIDYAFPSYKKKLIENHFLLNNSTLFYKDIRFIVSTLWSHVPDNYIALIENSINDYRLIRQKDLCDLIPITTKDTNLYHYYSLKYIEKELSQNKNYKTVIITHHLPSFDCINKKWRNQDIKYAYASNLNYLIEKYDIKYWIFGHQHESVDITIDNTRFLSNPLGYMDENQKEHFNNSWIIEI